MKNWTGLLLALCLCLTLSACGGETAPETAAPAPDVSASELAQAVWESQDDREGLEELTGEDLSAHLTDFYGLESWEEAAAYAASGMDAREIAVVLLADEEAAQAAADTLEAYRQSRQGDFFGYAPEQAELLEEAGVAVHGRYAVLLACADVPAAEGALDACLEGEWVPSMAPQTAEPAPTGEPRPTETQPARETPEPTPEPAPEPTPAPTPVPTPEASPRVVLNPDLDISGFKPFEAPNETTMELYDTSAIRAAWESGEEEGLTKKDADILARCREVLEKLVTGDMTDFEKELAVHDWLVEWGSYDQTVHNTATHTGRTGYRDPYGMLVGGYGNCLGYSTTFQLLMDLTGVECITVVGASADSTSDHAWNMVKLDGEWYCVDVTWDDPTMGSNPSATVRHRFFNVTSERMRESNHQWDYLCVPEATAAYYRWDGVSAKPEPRNAQDNT